MFMRNVAKCMEFEQLIMQYVTIVAPIIWSLWSLEAANANTADVFVFWLSVVALLDYLFKQGSDATGIPDMLTRKIREIINTQYDEFFSNKVYLVTFTLDLYMCN